MKRKLLLGVAAIAFTLSMSAQNREWHFNDETYLVKDQNGAVIESGVTLAQGEYEGLNGMTIIASADGKVKFELTKGFKGDEVFSQIATQGGINTGGSKHGFTINNMKAGDKITFAVAAGGTVSAEKLRGIDVYENDIEDIQASFRCQATDLGQQPRDYEYTMKNDGTIKVLSEQSIIIYDVIISSGSTNITNDTTNKTIISTEYYDLAGYQLKEAKAGLNIVKNFYEDGTVSVTKVYNK